MAKDSKAPELLQTIELVGGPWCGRAYQTVYQECPYIQIELEDEHGKTWHYRMCEDGMFRLIRHAEVFDSQNARKKKRKR